jgi:hypothetical protein
MFFFNFFILKILQLLRSKSEVVPVDQNRSIKADRGRGGDIIYFVDLRNKRS